MTRVPAVGAYRWWVLAAGTFATAANAALLVGVPALAPAIGDAFGLSLAQVGLTLSAIWVGPSITLIPLGMLTDRVGERAVLVAGLAVAGAVLVVATRARDWASFTVLLSLAAAAGASVHSAAGRSILSWFGPHERGLALGIRQAAVPVGGMVAAFALPAVDAANGLPGATWALAGGCLAAAAFAAVVVRDPALVVARPSPGTAAHRDPRVLRIALLSALLLVGHIAVGGFVTLFLHDERGLSAGLAAAVLGLTQFAAVASRVAAGRWSDVVGSREGPLRAIAATSTVSLVVVAVLLEAPTPLLVPAFVLAGGVAMSWNGVALTATAEAAGIARSGAAIGVQQAVLAVAGALVPAAFALVVAGTSWRAGYLLAAVGPLVVWALLRRGAG